MVVTMPMTKDEIKTLITAYSELTTQLTQMNLILQSIDVSNKEISDEFRNGFKKEICEHVSEAIVIHQKDTFNTVKALVDTAITNSTTSAETISNSIKNLYWKFAGTVVILVGMITLISELFGNK